MESVESIENVKLELLLTRLTLGSIPLIFFTINLDGREFVLEGKMKNIIRKDISTLNILDPSSTKEHRVRSEVAKEGFISAVRKLVTEGESFATPLRQEWREPHHVWSVLRSP